MKERKVLNIAAMEDVKAQYRAALVWLKKINGKTIDWIAKAANCSTRHIQRTLSGEAKGGVGGAVGERIANAFGLSYSDMFSLGQWILDGKEPTAWMAPPREQVLETRDVPASETSDNLGREPAPLPDAQPSGNEELLELYRENSRLLKKENQRLQSEAETGRLLERLEQMEEKIDKLTETLEASRSGISQENPIAAVVEENVSIHAVLPAARLQSGSKNRE